MLQQPELLAPAGSLETLKYAVMYGADDVYCAHRNSACGPPRST